MGTSIVNEPLVPLSRLVDTINDRFGTDFNQADQYFFDQVVETAILSDDIKTAAKVNPADKFELVFKNILQEIFAERIDQNEEIFARFMNDNQFQKLVTSWLAKQAFTKLKSDDNF